MRILVTGSEGFVGRHVVALLRERHDVVGLDLRGLGAERGDVRRPLPGGALDGTDVVVHLAALAGVAPSLRSPERYRTTNVDGTAHVLAAARDAAVPRVVMASSSSVYGECPAPATEQRTLDPRSPYAATKATAEGMAAAHVATGAEVVVVRPFTIVGPGQRADMLVSRLLAGERLTLWDFERDFTPVGAVAAAVARACEAPMPSPFEVFNLGSGRPVGAAGLLDAVAEATGRRPAVEWGPPRPGEPRRTWADARRARAVLGFAPDTDLVETLRAQDRTSTTAPLAAAGM